MSLYGNGPNPGSLSSDSHPVRGARTRACASISRVDAESSNTGDGADEGYSPSQQAPPHQDPGEAETDPDASEALPTAVPDPTHQVNLFA